MFGLGFPEILIILAIFFFLFGAKRLPEIGEGLGKTVRELRNIRGDRKAVKEEKKKDQGEKDPEGNVGSDLKKEVEGIPGLKEVKEIKETVDQVRSIKRILK